MQVRWFIVLLMLTLSACGENPVAQKGEKGDQGPQGAGGGGRRWDRRCRDQRGLTVVPTGQLGTAAHVGNRA
jgi:hypothetical protein